MAPHILNDPNHICNVFMRDTIFCFFKAKYLSSNVLWASAKSGAFKGYTSDKDIRINNVAKDGNGDGYYFIFDASLSNPIYGNSNTVQPPAVVMNYIIKY